MRRVTEGGSDLFVYVSSSDFAGGPDGGAPQDAVSALELDLRSGALKHVQTIEKLRSPTYMVRNPRVPVLYVLERWIKEDKGTPTPEQMKGDAVVSFAIDGKSGALSLLGRASTGGQSPMHLQTDKNGGYAFFANPGRPKDPDPKEGHATAIRLNADGTPGRITGSVHYAPRPPVWRNRPKTYPHSIFPDPAGRRVFVPQLMTDRVVIYDFDTDSGALSEGKQPYVQVSSGAGPRHVAFHPGGRFFYVVNSFDATLSAFSYDVETGLCSIVQTISVHPENFAGKKNISHAMVAPGGRHLYCSHRTHGSIAVFAINQQTGELKLASRHESLGARPRDFAFDASGRMMLVTNQNSNTVISFHVNTDSGALKPTGKQIVVYSPNCVVFGPED
jgi:6-phosphogluconolactonase